MKTVKKVLLVMIALALVSLSGVPAEAKYCPGPPELLEREVAPILTNETDVVANTLASVLSGDYEVGRLGYS